MLEVSIYTIEKEEVELLSGVSLVGHASEYEGNITQSICTTLSTISNSINEIYPDCVKSLERGNVYITLSSVPENYRSRVFAYLEILVMSIALLNEQYPKSFIIHKYKEEVN